MKKAGSPGSKAGHRILVTGGAGFIGSEFVRQVSALGAAVSVIDKLTYAGDRQRLRGLDRQISFHKGDICDAGFLDKVFRRESPDSVVHFAAETHVDRSISDASLFVRTNVQGTHALLSAARRYAVRRFVHISSDEVYGEIRRGAFREESPLRPSSPYSASKASADLLVQAFMRTYRFPALIVRPSNNYGPWQFPEKLIPVIIHRALHNRTVPIYARGLNRREWICVSDCASGILCALQKGKDGEVYNLGSGHEEKNLDIARKILEILQRRTSLIKFVVDRPGHDFRYALDSAKMRSLGWAPKLTFAEGISETVGWYAHHREWLAGKSGAKDAARDA
ncbi:MAG: dTDP-glucose 4,6-dehydratase [Candidatus Omnitrophica bacterium]|nr:dTDP-glucose 4,6-dehydratase [Candidatus Omnitrophota bacterium]